MENELMLTEDIFEEWNSNDEQTLLGINIKNVGRITVLHRLTGYMVMIYGIQSQALRILKVDSGWQAEGLT